MKPRTTQEIFDLMESYVTSAALCAAMELGLFWLIHSRGLITKDEVRAASLHKLQLPRKGVFWDIGGGSGSISIEAARLNPDLQIYIIEKKEEEQQNIL